MKKSRGILGATFAVSAANIVSGILGVGRGLYVAHALPPAEFGIWTLMLTLLGYASYSDAGVNHAMLVEMPRRMGRGDEEGADRVERESFSSIALISGTISIGLLIAALIPHATGSRWWRLMVLLSAGVFVYAMLNFYNVAVRVRGDFTAISVSVVAAAVVSFAAVIVWQLLQHALTADAVSAALIGGQLVGLLVLLRSGGGHLRWSFDWRALAVLLRIGFPLSLIPIGFTLFQSIDRWIVARAVEPRVFGYYGFGATIGTFLLLVPNALTYVLFTKQLQRFGATGDARASASLVWPPLVACSALMTLAAAEAAVALPFLVRYVLPAYTPGTFAAILQVIGNCLLFAVPVSSAYLISINRQREIYVALAASLAGEALLVAVSVYATRSINGAAAAVLASNAAYSALLTTLALRRLAGGGRDVLGRLFRILSPFVLAGGAAVALMWIDPYAGTLGSDSVRLLWHGAAVALVCVPLLVWMAIREGVLQQPQVTLWLARMGSYAPNARRSP